MQSSTRFTLWTACALVGLAGMAHAQVKGGSVSLNPHIGVYVFDNDQDLDTGPAFGLNTGYHFNPHWAAEGAFEFIDSEDKSNSDVDVYQYRLEGLYHFMPDRRFVPFLAAGGGGLTIDPDNGSADTDPLASYGLGAKFFITETIALRADARHIISFQNTENNFLGTVGVNFAFGGDSPEPKQQVAEVKLADTDGDGVTDDRDRCPGTARGVKVDSTGCAVVVDADGDGVPDDADRCPSTPRGTDVDASGCKKAVDTDKDGVLDGTDRCAGSPMGSKVDARGCWVLSGIRFESGSSKLDRNSTASLDDAIEVLRKNPDERLEIGGHTDSTGPKALNERLSKARAMSVLDYMVSKGVNRDKLSARGYASSDPAASNETAEGRAKNRRVELTAVDE